MIGIVVVSHSDALARAARELALQMATGDQPVVACAGGLDEHTLGTDAERISAAIDEADSGDGVLVLMDLGSALMSAEMAVEFLNPGVAGRVQLSGAPLVEGLVAAVVTAASGASLAEVRAEAERALQTKSEHLGFDPAAVPEVKPVTGQRLTLIIPNALGLHARPVAALVQLLSRAGIATQVTNLTRGIGPVKGTSLVSVAGLQARQGDEVEIVADGDDSAAAKLFAQLRRLVEDNFGDPVQSAATAVTQDVSFAGPLRQLELAVLPGEGLVPFDEALDQARAELRDLVELARRVVSDDAAEMVAAQLVFLDDSAVVGPVRQRIEAGASAAQAWSDHLDSMRKIFSGMDDDYLRAREQDVWSLQQRVLRCIMGAPEPDVAGLDGVVLTRIIDAPTAVQLNVARVAGVVTAEGGRLGHGAMILGLRGIPLMADAADSYAATEPGGTVTVGVR